MIMLIMSKGPESGISMPRRRFLNVLRFTALSAVTGVLTGCDLVQAENCYNRLRSYGKNLGNLVRKNREELLVDNPQLAQAITFQAGEFRGQPGLSDNSSRDQLSFAVRGAVLVSRNKLNSKQLTREERTELVFIIAYTNQIINAAQLSSEDRHSLTIDQSKAVLIFALNRANEVYQNPNGKNCFSEGTNLD